MSKIQNFISLSTTEAKYIAVSSYCTQLLWMQKLLLDNGILQENLTIYCDNTNAINISKNHVQHSRTKHIEIRHHFIRELIEDGTHTLEFIHTNDQKADLFTKPLFFLFRYIIFYTSFLWPFSDSKHCIYPWHIYLMMLLSHFTYLSMYCFLSLLIHMFLIDCMQSFILFHTKMLWWVLFKMFQKDRLSKSIMPWTLFLQSFSRVCVKIRFYCIQQVNISCVIYDFSHISFVCCGFVTNCQMGRLLGHMWNMLWTYVI